MRFSELSKLARKIASTTSKREKVLLLASLIRELDPEEAEKAVLILTGKIFKDERRLDVSWSTVLRVARTLSKERRVEGVDLGEVVSSLMRSARRQTSLFEVEQTVPEVYRQLERIAGISGQGSRRRKEEVLRSLLSSLSPEEVWLLTNALVGETRLGLNEGLLLEAIAEAKGLPREAVIRTAMLVGEPYSLLKMSRREILKVRPVPFRPIRPMLAQTAQDLEEALRELGRCALEYKLDGVRVQVHSDGEKVRMFSRRMSDITEMVPEIAGLRLGRVILEGELIAEREGPLPFQVLMRRLRRSGLDESLVEEIPLKLYLFDVLLVGERSLIDSPYLERRSALEDLIEEIGSDRVRPVPCIVTESLEEARDFFRRAVEDGHEGVMLKDLKSPYVPGTRGRHWLKFKRTNTLDLVIVAAERGYGRRHRWFSDYYLAARTEEGFEIVGKTFKGLSDEEFEWMTRKLESIAVERTDGFIRVKPEIVVEVAFNEVQRSPKYGSGLALRFARIVRIREDKSPEEADTLERVREIFRNQMRRSGRQESEFETQ